MECPPVPYGNAVSMPVALPANVIETHVSSCEVTTLEHEIWNDTMELGSNISFSFLCCGAKLLEVLCSLWDSLVEEFKIDAASLL